MKAFITTLLLSVAVVSGARTTTSETNGATDAGMVTTATNQRFSTEQDAKQISHFTWGADVGSTIDLTGQDLTSIDLTACLGYKNKFIRFIGAGAGVKMMVSNNSRVYPVFAMFRSGFSSRHTPCFLEVKAGCALMNLHDDIYQRNFYGSLGVGFTLAHGRTFSSHFTLAYEFVPMHDSTANGQTFRFKDLHSASIKIGASF